MENICQSYLYRLYFVQKPKCHKRPTGPQRNTEKIVVITINSCSYSTLQLKLKCFDFSISKSPFLAIEHLPIFFFSSSKSISISRNVCGSTSSHCHFQAETICNEGHYSKSQSVVIVKLVYFKPYFRNGVLHDVLHCTMS